MERKDVIRALIGTDLMQKNLYERIISSMNIHYSMHRILLYLYENDCRSMSQKDIALFLRISPAAVAVTLKRMEKDGYIRKIMLGSDNRVNSVEMTEKGKGIIDKTIRFRDEFELNLFSGFSEKDLENLYDYLMKMQEAIRVFPANSALFDGVRNEVV